MNWGCLYSILNKWGISFHGCVLNLRKILWNLFVYLNTRIKGTEPNILQQYKGGSEVESLNLSGGYASNFWYNVYCALKIVFPILTQRAYIGKGEN